MNDVKKNKIISWLQENKRLLIGLITIILLVVMIFFVDFPRLIDKIMLIGFWGTFLFVIFYTVAFNLRAYKLKLIFRGIEQNISYSTSYFSIGICFTINDLTPGKIGDFAKMGFIKDQENIKLSESVCGVAIERVLDLILLFLISLFALIYLYISSINKSRAITLLGQCMQIYLAIGAILIIGILIFLLLLIYKLEFVLKIIGKISTKLADFVARFFINFKEGMKKFKDHKRELIYITLLGILTWSVDAFIVVIFFYLSGYHLNIFLLVLAMILKIFSKTFPITPGGWGISENVGSLFVYFFYPHIEFTEILSIFIIDHLFRSAYLFFYGGYSIFHYNFKIKQVKN